MSSRMVWFPSARANCFRFTVQNSLSISKPSCESLIEKSKDWLILLSDSKSLRYSALAASTCGRALTLSPRISIDEKKPDSSMPRILGKAVLRSGPAIKRLANGYSSCHKQPDMRHLLIRNMGPLRINS